MRKAIFKINDPDLKDYFSEIRINEYKKLPSSIVLNFDFLAGSNTLDMVLYNIFLDKSGYDIDDAIDVFYRIKREDLISLVKCGREALDASISRLIKDGWLFVLKEVGKPNAYYART